MIARLLLGTLVVLTSAAVAQASLVRVEFTAELDRENSEGTAVQTVEGYFLFDDTSTGVYVAPVFEKFALAELIEFGIRIGDEHLKSNQGIVMRTGGDRLPSSLNLPRWFDTSVSSFGVRVGEVRYHRELKQFTSDEELERDDVVSGGLPILFQPAVTLGLTVDGTVDAPRMNSLVPPALEQLSGARLTIHGGFNSAEWVRTDGVLAHWFIETTAHYNITSLTIVPEPSGLVLLGCCAIPLLVTGRTACSS